MAKLSAKELQKIEETSIKEYEEKILNPSAWQELLKSKKPKKYKIPNYAEAMDIIDFARRCVLDYGLQKICQDDLPYSTHLLKIIRSFSQIENAMIYLENEFWAEKAVSEVLKNV